MKIGIGRKEKEYGTVSSHGVSLVSMQKAESPQCLVPYLSLSSSCSVGDGEWEMVLLLALSSTDDDLRCIYRNT